MNIHFNPEIQMGLANFFIVTYVAVCIGIIFFAFFTRWGKH